MISTLQNNLVLSLFGATAAELNENRKAAQAFTKNKETPLLSSQEQLAQNRVQQVCAQAFKDVGVKQPVRIVFEKSDTALNAEYMLTWSHWQRVPVMKLSYWHVGELEDLSRIYAIAGHEAMHGYHEHALMRGLISGAATLEVTNVVHYFLEKTSLKNSNLVFSGSLFATSLFLSWLIGMLLSHLFERDADISSAKKLHTAADLIQLFEQDCQAEDQLSKLQRLVSYVTCPHPPSRSRINYLQPFTHTANQSLLFQSNTYKKIHSEIEVQEAEFKLLQLD